MEDVAKKFFDSLSDENKSLIEEIRRETEVGRQKKLECIAAWAITSPFYSADLRLLMTGLRVSTFGDQQSGGYQKAMLCCDLGDKIEADGLGHYPLVYLASSSDVAFAIGLRFRQIYLVDPELSHDSTLGLIREILSPFELKEEAEADGGRTFRCMVNFGHGKEEVLVHCVPVTAEELKLADDSIIGGVISFQNGGDVHPMLFPALWMKIIMGGIIYDNLPSTIETEAFTDHWQGDDQSLAPNAPLAAEVARSVSDTAKGYGWDTVFPFPGYQSPYYRRIGEIPVSFVHRMEAAMREKQNQARRMTKLIDGIRSASASKDSQAS